MKVTDVLVDADRQAERVGNRYWIARSVIVRDILPPCDTSQTATRLAPRHSPGFYDAIMRSKRGLPLLIAVVLQAPILLSQTDWQAVRDLPEETPIAVNLKHARGLHHCWVQSASVDALTCDRDDEDPHRAIFARDEIRKVYRTPEPHLERSRTPPFGAGGAVVGSITILVIFQNGAAASVAAGSVGTALLVRHFNHGKLIYRSPSARSPGTGEALAARR